MSTVLLLAASNLFMTVAWYGHLKFKHLPLWRVVLISWAIAFFEYCLQVPANRWGYGRFTAIQLKTMQEVISIGVFVLFALAYFHEWPRWNHLLAFGLLVGAVYLVFLPASGAPA